MAIFLINNSEEHLTNWKIKDNDFLACLSKHENR